MKNLYLLIIFVSITIVGFGQKEIVFNINHKLAEETFKLNFESTNNLDQAFKVTRLEYYISEISITHDNGLQTKVEDFWILTRGTKKVEKILGTYDISSIEKISFFVGVDPDHNHLDPSLYESEHPLSPKNPSMHWGWTAGYRFIAFEGTSGANFSTVWQLHGLGDENYFKTELEIVQREEGNQLHIDLDADYSKALENIQIANGPISHGAIGDAQACLVNLNEKVFTQSVGSTGTSDLISSHFEISPNPSMNGKIQILLPGNAFSDNRISVYNLNGKLIASFTANTSISELSINSPGLYIMQVEAKGHHFPPQRFIIK